MTKLPRNKKRQTALTLPGVLVITTLLSILFLYNIESVLATCFLDPGTGVTHCADPTPPPINDNPNHYQDEDLNPTPAPDPDPSGDNKPPSGDNKPHSDPKEELPIVIGKGFLNDLYGFVVKFGGYLVGLAGKLLNWAVSDFVVGFGEIYLRWGVGFAVEKGWAVIRDVLNLSFIFAIVYIGIRLILDADDSSAKRSLGYLLAAALLINFSLFISKFVIDFSNSLAAIIYNTGLAQAQRDLGASFINLLGLSTLVDNGSGTLDVGGTTASGLAIIFGTFIFMLMALYALAAGAFLLFVRGIVLLFFMIFSPIMFLGWIFPQFKSFSSKYWSMFLANAFMAPAYMFCIYLTFNIMNGFKFQIKTEGGGNMGSLFTQNYAAGVNAMIVFVLAIGLMLASISIAKRMGAFGGGLVVSVGNSMTGFGKRILQGAAGGLTRGALDRSGGFGRAVSTWTPLRDISDRAVKNSAWSGADRKRRSSEASTREADRKRRSTVASANADIDAGLASAKRLNKLRTKTTPLSAAEQTEKDGLEKIEAKMRTAATGLTKTELEEMGASRRNKIAHLLTSQQSKDFNKSDKVGAGEIDSFNATRKAAIIKKITGPGGSLNVAAISKLSKHQLATLGADWLMENAHLLSPSQFDEIRKTGDDSSVFSDEQAASFSEKRTNKFKEVIKNLTDSANQTLLTAYLEGIKTKHKEIASLPIEVLTNSITAGYMNSKVLKEIDNKSEIERDEKTTIAANVRRLASYGVRAAIDGERYLNTAKVVTDGEWV